MALGDPGQQGVIVLGLLGEEQQQAQRVA